MAEQQKNQRDFKIKNRVLKQTVDIKLAENLSPITKKLEKVNATPKQLGEVFEKSQPSNIIPQPAIESTPYSQPIENKEGMIYDTELENTLKNTTNNTGFFQTYENQKHDWMWNRYLGKKLGGTEV